MKPQPKARGHSLLRVVVFGDPHLTLEPPGNRDPATWVAEVEHLFKQVYEVAEQCRADRVACTGDWFHSKGRTSFATLVWAMRLIEPIVKRFGPIITAIGNHDIIGNNVTSVVSQPLGVLMRAGLVTAESQQHVSPVHYGNDYATRVRRSKFVKTLYITHGDDLEQPATTGDVVINGHIHAPPKDGTTSYSAFNLGCLNRVSITEAAWEPRVAVVTIREALPSVTFVTLPLLAVGDSAFVVDRLAPTDSTTANEFAQSLIDDNAAIDPVMMLRRYAEQTSGTTREGVALAVRLIEESV